MAFKPDLVRTLERYFGLAAVIFSIAAFLFFGYEIISGLGGILSTIQSDPSYSNASGLPILMIASVILIPVFLILFFYLIEKSDSRYDRYGIMRVFAILVSSNILLTFLLPYIISLPAIPNLFQYSPYATITVSLYQYAFQYVLFFLAPILVISVIYMISRDYGSGRNLLKGIIPDDVPALGLSTISWIPIMVIFGLYYFSSGGDSFSFILYGTEFFILSYCFVRFGLPASTVLYLSFASINIVSTWSSEAGTTMGSYVSLSLGFFVLIWAFIGISSIFTAMFTFIKRGGAVKIKRSAHKVMQSGTVKRTMSPWINSSCPSCGSVTYKINNDGSLACLKCSHVIDKDAEGPINVRIDLRSSRF